MKCEKKCNFTACSCIGVLISIIVGTLVGVGFAFNFFPNIIIAIAIGAGLSILALIFLFSAIINNTNSPSYDLTKCLCNNSDCLLAAIFGTLISSLILLSVDIVFTVLFVQIFVAIWAFFLALLIIGIISFISCIVCKMCND